MSKRIRDGVVMDPSVFIIDEKKPGFPVLARIFQFLAIMIGSWSSISVLLECLAVPANKPHINLAVFIITVLVFALCLHPTYDVVKLFFGALFYVLFFYSRMPRLKNGFYIIENLVINRLTSYYGYPSLRFKANNSAATTDTTLLMIMVLIPMVTLLTVAIVRSKYVNLCSLFLFLPVSASFMLGIIPSERYLITYVISVLYLTQSGFSFRHIQNKEQKTLLHRINSRAAVWLSLMGVMLFYLMKLFVTPEEYEGVTKIKEMKTEMQSTLLNFSIEDVTKRFTDFRFPSRNVSVGGLNGGELGKTGRVKYTNTEHLRITAPLTSATEGIYLKGYVGSVYTGDKWEGHAKATTKQYQKLLEQISVPEFDSMNQVGIVLNLFTSSSDLKASKTTITKIKIPQFHYYLGKMNIEYMAANEKYLYAPYFTDYNQLEEMKYLEDLYLAPAKKQDHYELSYYFDITLGPAFSNYYFDAIQGNMGNYSTYEKLYREYVYQNYTMLPEKGLERLKQDFGSEKTRTAIKSIPERIEYVKSYLHQNTQYSLSPGKLPEDEDFVEYFLYKNRVGYCAHYASAATLMLRAMGVPARYVEGYAIGTSDIIQSQANSTQDVTYQSDSGTSENNVVQVELIAKDYNAHAWVEVYVDNCGWIPVEFTPGSAVDYNNTVMEDMAVVGEDMNRHEEELEEPTETLDTPSPTPVEEEKEEPVDIPEEATDTTTGKDSTKEQAKQVDRAFVVAFLIIMIVIAIIALLLRNRSRRRARYTKNKNKKALYLFAEIEKMLASCHSIPKRVSLEDSEDYVKVNCSFIRYEVFEGLMETVRKARFGGGRITSYELKEVEQFHQNLYGELCNNLSFAKRIYLKFILFV
jgi:transglutaminase-like putative cysteine protease